MRLLSLSLLLTVLSLTPVLAGRLDIAVIQFPEAKTVDQLEAAFTKESLFEVTNSDRTRSSEKALKGGTVLFAQSLSLARGGAFNSSTRLNNQRAEVKGLLGAEALEVSIDIMEGALGGLRSFQNRIYKGSAPLPSGGVRVISLRQVQGKAPKIVKGQSKVETYELTTVLVAQYIP